MWYPTLKSMDVETQEQDREKHRFFILVLEKEYEKSSEIQQ